MGKNELQRLNIDDIPFFRDTMPKDYVPHAPSGKEKEQADRLCRWLFHELYDKNGELKYKQKSLGEWIDEARKE